MHVVITGATGEIGKCLLPLLLKDENINQITVFSRRTLAVEHQKLTVLIVDFNSLSSVNLAGADVGICCLGTTMAKAGSKSAFERVDFDYVVGFAKLMKANGASQFHVVSASGANKTSFFFYNRVKGAMEDEVRSLSFNTTCIYRPALLDSERTEKRSGERFAILLFRLINPLLIGPLKHFKSIKTKVVAAGIHARIVQPASGLHIIASGDISASSD